jgi:hypothetical protein
MPLIRSLRGTLEPFRSIFNAHVDVVRLVAIVSPT